MVEPENKVKAVVTDKYGNEVPNVIVKFTASNEAIPKTVMLLPTIMVKRF